MQIVIEVSEDDYEGLKYLEDIGMSGFISVIRDSTMLPKNHGRLIDADKLKAWFFRPYSNEESYSNIDVGNAIDDASTILEAEV